MAFGLKGAKTPPVQEVPKGDYKVKITKILTSDSEEIQTKYFNVEVEETTINANGEAIKRTVIKKVPNSWILIEGIICPDQGVPEKLASVFIGMVNKKTGEPSVRGEHQLSRFLIAAGFINSQEQLPDTITQEEIFMALQGKIINVYVYYQTD